MLVYGRNVATEYLNFNNESIKKIIIQEGFSDKNVISLVENSKIPVIYKKKKDMDFLAKGVHQGIILDVTEFQYYSLDSVLDSESDFVLIIDHLEDPHNLGAIIRTAESAGVNAIILPQNREVQINSTVMKTSAGTLFKLKIVRVSNLVQTINKLKENSFWVIGTAMDGEDYKDIDYTGRVALVIGNEGHGMSRLVRESCDFVASIPMRGTVNSLNASVAAGIMIYEVVRNRK